MTFKDIIEDDLGSVFLGHGEFAETASVEYGGQTFNLPLVIDRDATAERNRAAADHADGFHLCDVVVYAKEADFGFVPRKNARMAINGEKHVIEKVSRDMGGLTIYLNQITE